jgi:hypothetical protein
MLHTDSSNRSLTNLKKSGSRHDIGELSKGILSNRGMNIRNIKTKNDKNDLEHVFTPTKTPDINPLKTPLMKYEDSNEKRQKNQQMS